MSITKEKKVEVIKDYQRKENDTGSPEVQVAILTERISKLTDHMNIHKKDFHSRYGLLKLVSRRRKLLKYIKRRDEAKYSEIIKRLKLRK
ncbi:MAG: 30S ribosomal protein S15 [Elusimicrobiota bacterium]